MSVTVLVIIVLAVVLIAGLPNWYGGGSPYAAWGYYPVGGIGLLLVVLLVLLLAGVIR